MAAVTVDELVKQTSIQPERLDEKVNNDHLLKIALLLRSWRLVALHLGLSDIDVSDLEKEGKDEQEKRIKALQKWKDKFAFKATYRMLVEVLLQLSMADTAEKICHILKETDNMVPQVRRKIDANVTTSDIENPTGEITTPYQNHELCMKLSVEVATNVADYSLSYVNDLFRSFTNHVLLPRPAIIAKKCASITWFIPANLGTHITRMAQETSNMFAEKHILEVMLEGECIYPMNSKHSLLETEPPLLQTEPPLLQTESPLLQTEPPPLQTEPLLLETEPPLLESEPPLQESEPPLQESEPPLLETEPPLLETEPPLLETEPPPLETEPPLLETEPPLLETEPPPLETEPPLLESEPPLLQTEPPLLQTEPPLLETEPPLLETEPPLLETDPPLLETEPPLLETEHPLLETDPPLLETEHPLLETEPPLLESEVVALKKKALGMVPQEHRKRKLDEDAESDQPTPKRPSKAGPSKPSQRTLKFLHKALPGESGGYDCEFVDPPPKVLETKCPICLHVLRKPKQTDCCGQIFCETCIEPVQTCPMCKNADFSTFHDKKLQRALNELQVRCTYQERGCTWTGELGKLDTHFNWDDLSSGCEFADIHCKFSCVGCETQMTYKDMMVHMKEAQPHHMQLVTEKVEEQESEINQLHSELKNSKELLMRIQQQIRGVAPYLPSHDEQFHQLMRESRELTQLLDTPMSELVQKSLQTAKPSQRISADFSFTMEDFDLHKRTNAEWYSRPFYTHERGYKMCVRIDANGYEWVKDTHVSLYTCMLKGEYDDELSWPFRGEIAVELLSQDPTHREGNHFTIQYDDNVRDRFARRVTVGERSPGWGNHTFLPHFKLGPYLKDDCLKIRLHIEFNIFFAAV